MGSTDNGKVFVETDGTMSLNGYDDITQNISDINSNIANIETTKADVSDLDNYVSINGANYLSGIYRFDRSNTQPSAQITLFNTDTVDALLLTESLIEYRVGDYYNILTFDAPTETTNLHVPNKNGTIATTNDITTSLSNYATLDTVQTITARKDFREIGTNIPVAIFNYEEDKYLYLHPTYLSAYDGVTLKSVNMYFPNTNGTLATTESIANSYVTLNTTQNIYGDKYFHYEFL